VAITRKTSVPALDRAIQFLLLAVLMATQTAQGQQAGPDVLTYHGDNLRTGWFAAETHLNTRNVRPASFGLLKTVLLDGRVDAQPLVVMDQNIDGRGIHDVVYVATEADTVYAIDARSGAVLWRRNYGTPVPYQYKNYDDNVFPVVGILGTPVIRRSAGLMYFVADTFDGQADAFYLHAIRLSDGGDAAPLAAIQFSVTIANGSTWSFDPHYQLQRPGLLEANGSIYVAFGSTGDSNPDIQRGCILRFDATTLQLLQAQVTNQLYEPFSPYYLSSIWQSGYAVAADAGGDVYFTTGNSSPYFPSYSNFFNQPDSIVRMSANLALVDSFTVANYFQLDQVDADLGSGGVLVLPDRLSAAPHLAVAGGKDGRAFLLNRDNMGGFTPGGPNNVQQTIYPGACWCGPAFFVGADGSGRVVTGGGNGVITWQLRESPSSQLVRESTTGSNVVNGLPDNGGVIPAISSNGTAPDSAIIWFVQRPASSSDVDPGTPLTLFAYSASNLAAPLFSATAGTWTHAVNSNANIVPVVANGRVYVASNRQLNIFGLIGDAPPAPALAVSVPAQVSCPASIEPSRAVQDPKAATHDFYGTICALDGPAMRLALRTGRSIAVDVSDAVAQQHTVLLTPGRPVHVQATFDQNSAAHAIRVSRSHVISPLTPPDR